MHCWITYIKLHHHLSMLELKVSCRIIILFTSKLTWFGYSVCFLWCGNQLFRFVEGMIKLHISGLTSPSILMINRKLCCFLINKISLQGEKCCEGTYRNETKSRCEIKHFIFVFDRKIQYTNWYLNNNYFHI